MEIAEKKRREIELLNRLSDEEVGKSFAYSHEILRYGTDALAHHYIMNEALKLQGSVNMVPFLRLSSENEILSEFLAKHSIFIDGQCYSKVQYELTEFEKVTAENSAFATPLSVLEDAGIFVPRHAYNVSGNNHRLVIYFDQDYMNILYNSNWAGDVDYAKALILLSKRWEPSDFLNKRLVELGMKFGRDMWYACVTGFEKNKYQQPSHITGLAEQLIKYYSGIIDRQFETFK